MQRQLAAVEQLIDDEKCCVTRFDFAPGAETGWHRHGLDYLICALSECQMTLEEPGGASRNVTVPAGTVYRREQGVEHNVINGGSSAMSFVEIELK